MKNKLLLLIAVCFASIAAFAIDEPTLPTTPATSLTLGNQYQVINTATSQYIGAGSGYGVYTTAITMVDRDDAATFVIDDTEDAYGSGITFVNVATDKYTFISNDGTNEGHPGWGEMHIDMASQGYNHFEIEMSGTSVYIKTPEYPMIDSESGDTIGTYSGYWGTVILEETYPQAVWGMLDKDDSANSCEWNLIDMTIYNARLELYDVITTYEDLTGIDQSAISAATTIYNDANATVEEMADAVEIVLAARNEVVCAGASSTNPVDATSLLTNPDFELLNISGWYCGFSSGQNATNVGYQGSSYTNSSYTYVNHEGETVNPYCTHFIEAWSATGVVFGSTEVSRSIGDAELSQTIKNLPAGNWQLSADVIAVQQTDTDFNPVTGTQLYATSGDYDMSTEIATADGVPEHITLVFASDGNTVTLGLRTQTTTANWIAADNFELLYYGNDSDNPYYFALVVQVQDSQTAIGTDLDEVRADAEVKAAYEEAMANAQALLNNTSAADEEYQAAAEALAAATTNLQTSISKYDSVLSEIEYINSVSDQAQEYGWTELIDELADLRDQIEAGYYDGTLTDDEIDAIDAQVHDAIADYISEYVQAGQDISMVIENPDFDTDFSGWTVEGTTPTFGGNGVAFGGGSNAIDGGIQPSDIGSGDAEVYHAVFDMYQVIKSLPAGLYTLSCNGFCRDDGGNGAQAELYAVLNGAEQTAAFVDLYEEGSPEMLYEDSDGSFSDQPATLNDGSAGYVPYGMAGANVYFYTGHYVNNFNILVTERGDLTIGARETGTDDWVIFDNFRLVYQGNDANVYADYIQELIDEVTSIDGMVSNEVDAQILDAVDLGYSALDENDSELSMAAINALQAAISAAETSIALIADLEELNDYTNDVRLGELTSSIAGELMELVEEVMDALDGDGFETDADVESYMVALKATYNKCALYDHADATEDSPADVSDIIITRNCVDEDGEGSYWGWDLFGGAGVGLDYGCIEIYNQDAGVGIEQILYNLSAGYYRLGVQGFYRAGNTNYGATCSIDAATEEADTIHYADIYAGETATRMVSIIVDAEAYSNLIGGTTSSTYTIPNSMTEANDAFDYDFYHNCLQFEVAEDGTDVPVGILKTGNVSGDWLIYSHWTLEYLGTTEPAEDPTTAIESVEGSGDVLATAIYGVNGTKLSRLTKGVNIVKSTLSDGTVKVTKVLVK